MNVSLVAVPNIDAIWPHLREGFHRSVMKTGGDIETGDLWVQCRNGSAFLIIVHETKHEMGHEINIVGASIWRPDTWQTGRKLRCLALYGSGMSDWIGDMHEMAKRLARDCRATSLVSEGRPGWAKIFPKAKVLRALYEEQI
jgi:hypothetical protein